MMTTSRASAARAATSVPKESAPSTLEKLREFLETARMKEKMGPHAFAEFEKELHERMMEAERDVVAAEMARADIDADAIVIDGKVHRRVLRQSQTYMTSGGEVVVERTLYKDRKDEDGRCVSPMELTLGIVGDFWTPRAAQQALWVTTQMTPKKGAELFERVGNMVPSKSSLDRLPKILAERWEDNREAFEKMLRDGLQIPEGTVSIAVSLDGVLAPIDGANSPTEVRARAAEEGRLSKGPAGYREASCATVSFCDDKGDLLGAIRMARAPEPKKKTLRGRVVDGRGARIGSLSSGDNIRVGAELRFDAEHATSGVTLYWQVTNTGSDARRANNLRGGFESSHGTKHETARYRGPHFIECFLVRHGVCAARSGAFTVNVG